MTGQGSRGHSRLSRAHCQRPPTGVVTWVRGPPARTVWPHSMTGQGSGGHSRLSRAHCQRPPTSVVTWVRGPPARSFWSHSMTGQCRGGHSRIFRAHCQCPPTGVVTWVRGPPARTVWPHSMEATRAYPVPAANAPRPAWSPGCAGLRPAPFGHIRGPTRAAEATRAYPVPAANASRPAWSPGCAVLQPTSCEVQKPIASYISQHFSSFPLPPQAEVNPSWQCVNKYDRQANKRLGRTPSKRKPASPAHVSPLFALLSPFTSAKIR